jgi:hypothetical protein
MNILRMESICPLTEFAPIWNIPLGVKKFEDEKTIDIIKSFLLKKEKDIISSIPYDYDGTTNLNPNSVTGRFAHYNLFNFKQECPSLNNLFEFFKKSYLEYIQTEELSPRETDIVCWFNALRKGEKVHEHNHGAGNDVYLSGNFILADHKTSTHYKCPYDRDVIISIPNFKGILTIFPSFVYHYSDTYNDDSVRHSIAFDIRIPGIQESKERQAITFWKNNDIHFS